MFLKVFFLHLNANELDIPRGRIMKLYTIGFTQKTAQQFFEILAKNGIERIIDIRLHPDGQLAGFSKKTDLIYFLNTINHCDYIHLDKLAPTEDILKEYRSSRNSIKFEHDFNALLVERDIPASLEKGIFESKVSCLLCSEAAPEHCHRRLVAEHLASVWENVEIIHL